MLEFIKFIYHVWNYNRILHYSEDRWQRLQEQRLRILLNHANQHSKFYRQRFQGLDLNTCRLQDLPILTKADMMANFNDFVTDARLKFDDLVLWITDLGNMGKYYLDEFIVCHTSGSQGQSAVVVQNRAAPFHLFAMQVARGHSMPKTWGTLFKKLFKARSRWAMILFKPCFIPSGVAFGYMPKASRRLANMLRLNFMDPLEENLRKLDEFKPNFITAYVHVLEQLAQAASQGKSTLAKNGSLELVIAISEPLTPEKQALIEKGLGVPVANHYALGECPALSLGCPQGKGAHVNTDMAILENVDDQYQPVPAGTPGSKVLLTNLMNHVQPFIRYEIDDVVTFSSEPCSCGNKLPLITAIAGRSNDLFWIVTPAGEVQKISHLIFKDAFLSLMEVAEFQIIQDGRNHFQVIVELVAGKTLTAEAVRHSIEEIAKIEDVPACLELEIKFIDKIPHEAKSGKLRRFINIVGKPNQ